MVCPASWLVNCGVQLQDPRAAETRSRPTANLPERETGAPNPRNAVAEPESRAARRQPSGSRSAQTGTNRDACRFEKWPSGGRQPLLPIDIFSTWANRDQSGLILLRSP